MNQGFFVGLIGACDENAKPVDIFALQGILEGEALVEDSIKWILIGQNTEDADKIDIFVTPTREAILDFVYGHHEILKASSTAFLKTHYHDHIPPLSRIAVMGFNNPVGH